MVFLIVGLVSACITWTVTMEELFRGFQEYLYRVRDHRLRIARSCGSGPGWWGAMVAYKLAYMPSCYYCLSHWVTLVLLVYLTPEPVIQGDSWYLLTFFLTEFLAVVVFTAFNVLRATLRGIQAWADQQQQQRRFPYGNPSL